MTVHEIIETIENASLRCIACELVDCENFWIRIASPRHHMWRGGLADHSAQVAEIAVGIGYMVDPNYDRLNKDLLTFGALLHDIGKAYMDEDEYQAPRVSVHEALGCHMVYEKLTKAGFCRSDVEMICNMIAVHSKIESVVLNKDSLFETTEAMIVPMADTISAFIYANDPQDLYERLNIKPAILRSVL